MKRTTFAASLAKRLLLVALVPLVVVGVYAALELARTQETAVDYRNSLLAETVRAEVDTALSAPVVAMRQFKTVDPASDAADLLLHSTILSLPFIESIRLIGADDRVVSAATRAEVRMRERDLIGIDQSRNPQVRTAKQTGEVVWSGVFTSMITSDRSVEVAVPLDRGVAVAMIDVESLDTHTRAARIEPDAVIVIVDSDGSVLFHTDPSVSAARPNWSDVVPIKDALAGRFGVHRYRQDAIPMLGSTAPLRAADWVVLVEQDWADASRPVVSTRWGIALAVLLVAVVAMVTASLIARRLGDPIDSLMEYVRHASAGDYSGNVERYRFEEIDELAQGVQSMVRAVSDREAELAAAQKELTASHEQLEMRNDQLRQEALQLEHAQEALEAAVEDLKRSNRDLQQFAYVASHDLQEPLRMIASYVELLRRRYQGNLDSDADDFIGFAVDGATRMQMMIQDLLDFSRVHTKGKPFAPVSLASVVESALANLQRSIGETGAEVECSELPTVMADHGQLARALQNLIGNSIKFRRADVPPRIAITAEHVGSTWEISVADNGIGINPSHADEVFDIFRRLEDRAEYPGTGIGLAVTKRIIERHGGSIRVEPMESGSKLVFTLPDVIAG